MSEERGTYASIASFDSTRILKRISAYEFRSPPRRKGLRPNRFSPAGDLSAGVIRYYRPGSAREHQLGGRYRQPLACNAWISSTIARRTSRRLSPCSTIPPTAGIYKPGGLGPVSSAAVPAAGRALDRRTPRRIIRADTRNDTRAMQYSPLPESRQRPRAGTIDAFACLPSVRRIPQDFLPRRRDERAEILRGGFPRWNAAGKRNFRGSRPPPPMPKRRHFLSAARRMTRTRARRWRGSYIPGTRALEI